MTSAAKSELLQTLSDAKEFCKLDEFLCERIEQAIAIVSAEEAK